MPANYSTNPSNPVNKNGGQMGQQNAMPAQQQYVVPNQQPKTIRDYLNIARSQGWGTTPGAPVPRFTDRPGDTQGFNINNRADDWQMTEMPQQAIPPAEPDNEYDKIPYTQKAKISPYIRAQERVRTVLPQIYQTMFPGRPLDGTLSQEEMKRWQGAVSHITGELIKKYDSEYADWKANEKREMDQWDKEYNMYNMKWVDSTMKGSVPYKSDGTPYASADEFIQEQMDRTARARAARRMQEKEMKSIEEIGAKPKKDVTMDKKVAAVKGNPQLKMNIQAYVKTQLAKSMGRSMLTQDEFQRMRAENPEEIARLTAEAFEFWDDEISKLVN